LYAVVLDFLTLTYTQHTITGTSIFAKIKILKRLTTGTLLLSFHLVLGDTEENGHKEKTPENIIYWIKGATTVRPYKKYGKRYQESVILHLY
jgi:hypothetical protein